MCNADPTTSTNETERVRKFKFAGGMDVILQNNKTLDWAFSNFYCTIIALCFQVITC